MQGTLLAFHEKRHKWWNDTPLPPWIDAIACDKLEIGDLAELKSSGRRSDRAAPHSKRLSTLLRLR